MTQRQQQKDLAKSLTTQGRLGEAAEVYLQLNLPRTAADLYLQAKDYRRAGDCYLRLFDYKAAAGCLFAAGDGAKAYSAVMRLGNWKDEVAYLTESKQFYHAGLHYDAKQNFEKALHCYVSVPAESPYFVEAMRAAIPIARSTGRLKPLGKLVHRAIQGKEMTRAHAQLVRVYGELLEAAAYTDKADSVFKQLLDADLIEAKDVPHDVAIRLDLPDTRGAISAQPSPVVDDDDGDDLFARKERYRLKKLIGSGAIGDVHLAEDSVLERTVAIKLLREQLCTDADARKWFTREAKVASKLNHENIVTILDVGMLGGRPFISMEYLEGNTLETMLDERKRPISPIVALKLLLPLCDALHHAHKNDVVHRDVRAENIVLTTDGKVKLLDFGMSKGSGQRITQESLMASAPTYLAPEVIQGKFLDHRADIYSMGVLMYRMLTGKFPFQLGEHVLAHQQFTAAIDPCKLNPEIPATVGKVIMTCLEKDRDQRYPTMAKLKAAIRESFK